MVQVSRRQFMQVTGSSLAASSLAVLGFSPSTALAEVRQFKLYRRPRSRAKPARTVLWAAAC